MADGVCWARHAARAIRQAAGTERTFTGLPFLPGLAAGQHHPGRKLRAPPRRSGRYAVTPPSFAHAVNDVDAPFVRNQDRDADP